ncbi:TPA: hypothetical protein NIC93_005388 [Pseudomonas aeruginosa]|nr:hypothetical protein [Pseudomonas aeruginosa]HCK0564466.1 hypothetical protein [Pseudomonas aeruginosa]
MALSTHLSNHKLYLLGMLCAILAWGMACIELGANTHLWFSGLSEQGYLQAWSDEMPRLASDGFVLSWSSRALLMLLDYLPTLLSAFGLALTGLFSAVWPRANAGRSATPGPWCTSACCPSWHSCSSHLSIRCKVLYYLSTCPTASVS